MKFRSSTIRAIVAAGSLSALAACGHKNDQQAAGDVATPGSAAVPVAPATGNPTVVADSTTPDHHSKLGGALVGAAAGHMLGGHAVAGAAVGALVQHERNKHQKP